MPRKEKIVVELSPEVVALLKRIADVIAPEHHAPPIGDTKRLVESDQRDHPVKWVPATEQIAGKVAERLDEELRLTPAEVEQVEELLDASGVEPSSDTVRAIEALLGASDQELREKGFDVPPRKKWWDNIEPGVD